MKYLLKRDATFSKQLRPDCIQLANTIEEFNILELTLASNDKKIIRPLYCQLYPTYSTKKYKELLWSESHGKDWTFYETEVMGLTTYEDTTILFDQFVEAINYINSRYDRYIKLPTLKDLTDNEHQHHSGDDSIMNLWHHEFELYGDRIKKLLEEDWWGKTWKKYPQNSDEYKELDSKWPYINFDTTVHYGWLTLNRLIHLWELLIGNTKPQHNPQNLEDVWKSTHLQFSVGNTQNTIPFDQLDYFFFKDEKKWGDLLLGYNTLGKHISECAVGNDVDAVSRQEIRTQDHFSTETYMAFKPDVPYDKFEINIIAEWIKENNLIDTWDWTDRTKSSIGFCVLGSLIYPRQWEDWRTIKISKKRPGAGKGMLKKLQWSLNYLKEMTEVINVELCSYNEENPIGWQDILKAQNMEP